MRMKYPTALVWAAACGAIACYASDADAIAITANIQARHMPFGTVLDPMYVSASSSQIAGYTRCGDSALWTGHYLAAESFRYNVTRAPDALANVKAAIAGIKSLVDVTATDLLARCIVPANSPYAAGIQSEEAANGIYQAPPNFWVGNTSRDEYVGVVFGLGIAYDMVNDAGVRDLSAQLVTRLIAALQANGWNIVTPSRSNPTFLVRPDVVLGLLQIARHLNPLQFSAAYVAQRQIPTLLVSTPLVVDTSNDDSYFKFNLDYLNLYGLIRLDTASEAANDMAAYYSILRNHTAGHQNALFDAVDRALRGPSNPRDAELLALLSQWLQRPRRDPYVDLSGTVPVCGGQACQPIPVPQRVTTDYLWQRSPFQLAGGGQGTIETAGIDYILPYWMARYYGVVSALNVQSAAASISAIAPDSLASIYGSNLAATTAQAASLPLPTSLGGITVSVKDAAGAARIAPLLYVSPSQINLMVPDGTAVGPATLTISGGGTNTTAIATVQTIAPALFSMNSAGTGVAAATAIQTQAGNPQAQFQIPVFNCTGSVCQSVPINLGVDTPVYLTLYGTGIRDVTSLKNVAVTINGVSVPVLYAGAQPSFAGLDQVNVALPLTLRGSGEANVVLTVDGQVSNTVTINIQ